MPTAAIALDYVRTEAVPADNGLLAWNFDCGDITNANTPSAGAMVLSKMVIGQTMTISNMLPNLRVAGVGATALAGCYLALYSSAGVLLGQSADQSTVWASSGSVLQAAPPAALTAASAGSLTLTAGTYVFAGRLIVTQSTTAAQFGGRAQGNSTVPNAGLVNSSGVFIGVPHSMQFTALSAVPSTITPMSGLVGIDYWFGLS